MNFEVSILPLIIGTLFNMGLGAMWYSPILFAKVWMKEAGVTMEDVNASPSDLPKIYGATAVTALITSYAIGFMINNLKIDSITDAFIFVTILWLGTNLPSIIKNWGFEGRTVKLGIINHGYDFVVYIIVSILYILL